MLGRKKSAPSTPTPVTPKSVIEPSPDAKRATDEDEDGDLCTDGPATASKDSGLTSRLEQLFRTEQLAHEETKSELAVERAAHDETAEKMVELQHRLEVTLQELANLERFVKMQQQVNTTPETPQQRERLMREEAYLKSRLSYVQQELNGGQGAAPVSKENRRASGDLGPIAAYKPNAGGDEEAALAI